jgi:hypothetical protein
MAFEFPDPARDVAVIVSTYDSITNSHRAATNALSMAYAYHSNEIAIKENEIRTLKKRNRMCVGSGLVMLLLAIII